MIFLLSGFLEPAKKTGREIDYIPDKKENIIIKI